MHVVCVCVCVCVLSAFLLCEGILCVCCFVVWYMMYVCVRVSVYVLHLFNYLMCCLCLACALFGVMYVPEILSV